MTKPTIRHAGPNDTVILKYLQDKHLAGYDCFGPYPTDAYWLVANTNGRIVNALGYVDRPDERQIMMLWEPGRAEAVAAYHLVKTVMEDAGNKTLWFISADSIPEKTKKYYSRWGFTRKGGNGKISIYVKEQ